MSKNNQILWTFICGVVFLVTVIVIALKIPNPSGFQCGVFYIVLAIAAAGFAAFLPGSIEIEVPQLVKAGGALAVLVFIIYVTVIRGGMCGFFPTTSKFPIAMSCKGDQVADVGFLIFQRSDVPTTQVYKTLANLAVSNEHPLFNRDCGAAGARFFRMIDEKEIDASDQNDALSGNNTGMIEIPAHVAQLFGNAHNAFVSMNTDIQGKLDNLSPFSVGPTKDQ